MTYPEKEARGLGWSQAIMLVFGLGAGIAGAVMVSDHLLLLSATVLAGAVTIGGIRGATAIVVAAIVDQGGADSVARSVLEASGFLSDSAGSCENCDKLLLAGQVVEPWDDVVVHHDCENPFKLDVERQEEGPEPVILLGDPVIYYPLPTQPA